MTTAMAIEGLLSGSVAFLDETCDDAGGCILRVQGVTKLLARRVVLLLQGKRLKDESIPLVL